MPNPRQYRLVVWADNEERILHTESFPQHTTPLGVAEWHTVCIQILWEHDYCPGTRWGLFLDDNLITGEHHDDHTQPASR